MRNERKETMIEFICGLFIGSIFTTVFTAILNVADDDRDEEDN